MLLFGERRLPFVRRSLLILPLWLVSTLYFWLWWFSQASKSSLPLYIPITTALIYETTLIPGVLLYLTLRAKVPSKRRAQKDKKVAVITLCVPSSESIDIVEKQLRAMSNISYPHDSWILDEGNNKIIKALAKEYGVKHFSRKGIAKYNQRSFPYQARTKAGNVNAWLDRVKRQKYEYFVQLDIDHIPLPTYLDKTLGHFRDPNIAWVQSPSVYGNLSYWTARGSAEQEMGMHGPLQMGFYGSTHLPLIVGSHAAYRMQAIREIGGFQPTRAEDQLNTLVLASKGWRGVFVPEVLACGDGPETLSAYLTQQYAWARSIVQVIKGYSWRYMKKLPAGQFLQFVFLQSWYLISTVTFLVLYFAPIVALLLNLHVVDMSVQQFLFRLLPFIITSFLILWSAKPLMQPRGLRFSWRGVLLHLIRWPSILSGIFSAIANRKKPYLVTPKGKFLLKVPTLRLYLPFLFLASLSAFAVIFSVVVRANKPSEAQISFALYDSLAMIGVCLIDLSVRLKKISLSLRTFLRFWLKPVGAVAGTMLVTGFAFANFFVAPLQTSLALSANKTVVAPYVNLANMKIDSLNNQQLDDEIASQRYALGQSATVPDIGIYSPTAQVHVNGPYINSIFMDWRENWMLAQGLVASNRTGATSLVTIEPKGDTDGARLLTNISKGMYDARLLTILNTIRLDPNTVYVRFAQEMELPDSFNWGAQDPTIYIAAYTHVVDLARTSGVKNVKWVWSPAGLPSAAAYYPGDQYVDVVGTTMLYDPFWSGDYHPTFYEVQAGRSWLELYNKPVWITEFGVGDEDTAFQTHLIQSALSEYKADGYQALVYLNIIDPNVKGPNYSLSDISVLGSNFVFNKDVPPVTTARSAPSSILKQKHSAQTKKPSTINLGSHGNWLVVHLKPISPRFAASTTTQKPAPIIRAKKPSINRQSSANNVGRRPSYKWLQPSLLKLLSPLHTSWFVGRTPKPAAIIHKIKPRRTLIQPNGFPKNSGLMCLRVITLLNNLKPRGQVKPDQATCEADNTNLNRIIDWS